MQDFSLDDLRRIVREAAGEPESMSLDGDIAATSFEELGYESLALIEVAARIHQQYGVMLDDDAMIGSLTPGELVGQVNRLNGAVR
jgi:act minimal PKS acyl carrier protein